MDNTLSVIGLQQPASQMFTSDWRSSEIMSRPQQLGLGLINPYNALLALTDSFMLAILSPDYPHQLQVQDSCIVCALTYKETIEKNQESRE